MDERRERQGGDPACWQDRVCAECGRMRAGPGPGPCENCGAPAAGASRPAPDPGPGTGAGSRGRPARDRDEEGRARNARPRDGLGRPLPYGAPGVERQPEGVDRTPDETLDEAQRLLDAGRPFHAHEVLEDAWKADEGPARELWRALAQLAVGVTHAARGNTRGATALLERAADGIARHGATPPYSVDAAGLAAWARVSAAGLNGDGPGPEATVPRLRAPGGD
ncbi:DUF309 domain-containing protein [Streptomyces zingiberis]|uniref:DUF309 domain-containing protein n=1 Tax=Streptomyces zingiberis TaxID=2053010 RepID=A0ABX1BVP8_9ACTN|nr:DUF309 domain-containing protein [Streptomyces zingiberis]NJQ00333.1 DUF309 domain-containing protein [Streptomyces zingiberis]